MKRGFKQIIAEAFELFVKDIISAKWAIILIVAYFVFLKKVFQITCPVVLFTGFPCPGCGLTRAGFHILHLDFFGAWQIHPFIYPIIVMVIIYSIERYVLMKKEMVMLKWYAVLMIIGLLLFYVWRMKRLFPDVSPMTYYPHNFLNRILIAIHEFA